MASMFNIDELGDIPAGTGADLLAGRDAHSSETGVYAQVSFL